MTNERAAAISERNYGIDLLRVIAMLYVVVLHILNYGGVLGAATEPGTVASAWLLRIWAMCAVNCYAMISGYVGYREEKRAYSYGRYLTMWLQAVFYGVLGAGIFLLTEPDMLYVKHMILAFAPVTTGQWWYFSAYTALFFVIPWLNKLMRCCTQREATAMAVGALLLFSVYPTAASLYHEPFQLEEGYSFLWLMVLYLVGAWMKKCRVPESRGSRFWLAVWLGCYVIVSAVKLLLLLGLKNTEVIVFESYLSPLVVGMAVAHVCIFARIRLPGRLKKVTAWLAPAAFGVFLLHMQWDVLDGLILGSFAGIAQLPAWLIPPAVMVCALAVLIVGLLIDRVRIWLFARLRINRLADRIAAKIQTFWEKIYLKMCAAEDRRI